MMKKLVSFLCCLVPFGAGAADFTPGTGNSADLSGLPGNSTAGDNVIITNGNGISSSGPLTVVGNMYIGRDATGTTGTNGDVYALIGIDSPFSILTGGALNIAGNLEVASGYELQIQNAASVAAIDVVIGTTSANNTITANGALNILNVNNLTLNGALTAASDLTLSANNIQANSIAASGTTATITSTGNIDVTAALQYNGAGTANVTAANATIAAGEIGNGNAAGKMTITAGNINTTGDIKNSGTELNIAAANGDIISGGRITSDNGALTINAKNLTVNGGSGNDASLALTGGTFTGVVSGATTFANGISFTGANDFSLETGTIDFGVAQELQWGDGKAKFKLETTDATNGNIALASINNMSEMLLNSARNITANSVINTGTLGVGASGDMTVGAIMTSGAAGKTDINVGGNLSASSVNNVGKTTLQGTNITISGGVDNAGTLLTITGGLNSGNTVSLGNVTNTSGQMNVSGYDITTGALTTNAGGMVFNATNNMTIGGAVLVNGGDMDMSLSSLDGVIRANGTVVVGESGALNIGGTTQKFQASDTITIAGDVNAASGDAEDGDLKVDVTTGALTIQSDENIIIGGNVNATDTAVSRTIRFDATQIDVGGDVLASGQGVLQFGSANTTNAGGQKFNVSGNLSATDGGRGDISAGTTVIDGTLSNNATGTLVLRGASVTADKIDLVGGILADGTPDRTNGVLVADTDDLTLTTTTDDIVIGGDIITKDKKLALKSAAAANITGKLETESSTSEIDIDAAGDVTLGGDIINYNGATVKILAAHIDAADSAVTNNANATMELGGSNTELVTTGNITNSGDLKITAANVTANAIVANDGAMDITAPNVNAHSITVNGGAINTTANNITVTDAIAITGDLNHVLTGGATTNGFNIIGNNARALVQAGDLTVSGALNANANSVGYVLSGNATIDGGINVVSGATTSLYASSITAGGVTNAGNLMLDVKSGANLGNVVVNSGMLTLNSNTATAASVIMSGLNIVAGNAELRGRGITVNGDFNAGILYQNYNGDITVRGTDVNIIANDYTINANSINVAGIDQTGSNLNLNTSDLTVNGEIETNGNLLTISAHNYTGISAKITGDVSGGVRFNNLGGLTVGGDYIFDNNSRLVVAGGPTSASHWSTISLADDNTFGQISNKGANLALVKIAGEFKSQISLANLASGTGLIGVGLTELPDISKALWLAHADGGISEQNGLDKLRNVNVVICNASGSMCYTYFDPADLVDTSDIAGAYLTVRNGSDIYIVFDDRFGGPIKIQKIQPIVERVPGYSPDAAVSAGALDNLIAGLQQKNGFSGTQAIELLPLVFRDAGLGTVGDELYKRLENYDEYRNGVGLERFSKLFQAREIEQIAGNVALNEHTNARSFEDRMFDEFIWNRNRKLKKAWVDTDFGMLYQKTTDGLHADGNRFSVSGGFDWQHSQTVIYGLTARVSHMSTDTASSLDLAYNATNDYIAGHIDTSVADTNIGMGGYMMKILGNKTRLYGNAFLDLHLFDVSRNQTYVDGEITGNGSAFSLTSEWGLLHDWLNQYIVGNMYVRAGYNTGFNVTEKVGGHDYMKMESDGYLMLTPGYSLMAQKRIYPSMWFQIRPYAAIGIEYDVLGAPDTAKYKFAAANSFTEYDLNIDPMWANIGGGVEFVSATGIQVGLDYRYQYNQDIQLHNIKISGSYRF